MTQLRMAAVLLAFVAAVTLAGAGVSAETHHVVGGWGPDFNATAWLLGRFFTVGDKLLFEYGGGDEKTVEVGRSEFATCNLTNPIRMLTDPVSHVALEDEGVRYFTSGDPESCRKGLKLPVTINPAHDHGHDFDPSPPYDPWKPDEPSKPDVPSPPYEPWEPDVPSPPHKVPPPPYEPYKPPPTPTPSPAAALLDAGLGLVLAAAFWISI
ncbi:uclacyanin 1-like [Salvia divinorum]|uniref:Uclacyanin 1-like n=1 Tax=Salvia divinorum TaxID=28513 RepID=A0ABD1FZK9_SALDI